MAVFLVLLGGALLVLVRPRWWRDRKDRQPDSRWRFSVRDLVIASGVFGLCLSFVLGAFQYRAEQSALADLVHPILQNYVSTVAFDDGHTGVVLLPIPG